MMTTNMLMMIMMMILMTMIGSILMAGPQEAAADWEGGKFLLNNG